MSENSPDPRTLRGQLHAQNEPPAAPQPPAEAEHRPTPEEAEIRAAEVEQRLLYTQVCLEKGIPAAGARFLYGTTEEEVAEAADRFVAVLRHVAGIEEPPPPRVPDLKQGQRGGVAFGPHSGAGNDTFRDRVRELRHGEWFA